MPGYKEDLEESAESRYAAEWGLASLLMGGVLTIIAPVTLVFNLIFWLQGPKVLARPDMQLAHSKQSANPSRSFPLIFSCY